MKLLIVGGVAGGASAAARARRLDENAEIIVFERGDYISFANCGLPYHIGGTIPSRESLLLMTPEKFLKRFDVTFRTGHLVTSIDPGGRTVTVRDLEKDESYQESYDSLILSPGSTPLVPPIPGKDHKDVLVLWTVPDMDAIMDRIRAGARRAVVVGGGFIGVETAENLVAAGLETTLVEKEPWILPFLDPEMTAPLTRALSEGGVRLLTGSTVEGIEEAPQGLRVLIQGAAPVHADFVVMAAGVRPNGELAKTAGLTTAPNGAIIVDEFLRTSSPHIYAVGDAVQTVHPILGERMSIPLAGPANRQGRMAAENALGGSVSCPGTIGASVVKVFDITAASAGASETQLNRRGIPHEKVYIHPSSHASYYPGSARISMKVLFSPEGVVLGAQAVGEDGVDKRIDVLATAIRKGLTVRDLTMLELCYAPPYGSAKDPVNYAGYVGCNVLDGLTKQVHVHDIPSDAFLLDVREPEEWELGTIPGSTHIPLDTLRQRLAEIPRNKPVVVFCAQGQRAYSAERMLRQKGYTVSNLSGGYLTWRMFHPETHRPAVTSEAAPAKTPEADAVVDASGLQCPGPLVQVSRAMKELAPGAVLLARATDRGFKSDLPAWCGSTGNTLLGMTEEKGVFTARVRKGGAQPPATGPKDLKRTTMVLFSGDMDKNLAALIIATGFASLGHQVTVFCTFWGLSILRKERPPRVKKGFLDRMFGMMLPRGPRKLALSKLHMMGAGTAMMKHVMRSKGVDSLPDMLSRAQSMGVVFQACEMSMGVMGITKEELIPGVETAGVGTFASLAEKSAATLFI